MSCVSSELDWRYPAGVIMIVNKHVFPKDMYFELHLRTRDPKLAMPALIFDNSTHYNQHKYSMYAYPSNNPSLVANRFKESSLSLRVLTNPQSAYVVDCPGMTWPFSSTCPMLICTEAWSLAVMRRLVAALSSGQSKGNYHFRGT